MQVFNIKKDGFKEIRKNIVLGTIPILVLAGGVGIAISFINSKQEEHQASALPIIIPVVVAALGFGLYRGVNRQKALFESYSLTITNNLITREQMNTPTISIYFNDIQEIAKNKNGSFTVKGKEAVNLIGIPLQIDNYAQLEMVLQQIQPIVVKDKISFLERYQSLSALVSIGLMLCVYTVNNKIIVALSGTALIALMVWSFIKIRSSKNVDSRTKRSVWWMILILASVVGVMIFKLAIPLDMLKH